MVFNICVNIHENMSSGFGADTKIVNRQRAITPKVGKPELQPMFFACHVMMFDICVKFHENMSKDFKLMEWTRKLLTDKGQ